MIQNVLADIGGIGIYGVISVMLFFTVFTAVLILALSQSSKHVRTMSDLPLQADSPQTQTDHEQAP